MVLLGIGVCVCHQARMLEVREEGPSHYKVISWPLKQRWYLREGFTYADPDMESEMSPRTSKSRGTEEMCSRWRQTDKGPEVEKLETSVKKSGRGARPGMLERRGQMARLQLGAGWEQFLGPRSRRLSTCKLDVTSYWIHDDLATKGSS